MKKILRLIFIFAVIMMMPFTASAVFEDTVDTKYENATELLSGLNIVRGYEDGSFRPLASITRAEYTAMIMRIMGIDNTAAIPSGFLDVPDEHWAAFSIASARGMHIVSGMDKYNFCPEMKVTYMQAIKMTVCALGYRIHAENAGGWPTGYASVAARLGILDGIDYTPDAEAKRGDVALMIYSALEVERCEEVTTADGAESFEPTGETLLSRVLNTEKKQGLVEANSITSIRNNVSVKLAEGEVMIDGEIYETGLENADSFLGYDASYYLTTAPDGEQKIAAIIKKKSNNLYKIAAQDIVDVQSDMTGYELECENQRYDIPADAVWIYNKKRLSDNDKTKDLLAPSGGTVEILENAKGTFVFITEYENYVFDGKNIGKKEISLYDKYNKVLKYNPDDRDMRVAITKDGQRVTVEDLVSWNILSVAASRDGKVIDVVVSSEKTEGKVNSCEKGNGRYWVQIGDVQYELADNFIIQNKDEINVGDSGVFYLDIFGKIAAADTETFSASTYGYLLDYDIEKGISENVSFRLLVADNKIVRYKLTDKIRFEREESGTMVCNQMDAVQVAHYFDRTPDPSNTNKIVRQLITYDLNQSGKVYKINLASSQADNSRFSCDVARDVRVYNKGKFDEKYIVDSETKAFYIPGNGENTSLNTSGKPFKYFETDKEYAVTFYDLKEDMKAGAVVITTTLPKHVFAPKISLANSNVMLIDKKTTALNDEGDTRTFLEGWVNGEYIKIKVDPDLSVRASFLKDCVKGNMIQYEMNEQETGCASEDETEEVLLLYKIIFDGSDEEKRTFDRFEVEMTNCEIGTSYGTVSYADGETLLLTFNGKNGTTFTLDDSISIFELNKASGKIQKISIRDIEKGAKVFLRQRYQRVKEILVIK